MEGITMNQHLNLKKYSCPACPERFKSLGDKRRHLRTEHPKGESDE